MKLIGELKEKVEAVESDMEKKAIIAHAGMLLTDDELTEVSGGNQKLRIIDCAIPGVAIPREVSADLFMEDWDH